MKYAVLWSIGLVFVLVVGFVLGVELGIKLDNPNLGFYVGIFPLMFLYLGVRLLVHGPGELGNATETRLAVPLAIGGLFLGFAVVAACTYFGQYWLLAVLGIAAFAYSLPERHIPGFRSAIGFVGALVAIYGILGVIAQILAVFWTTPD